MGTTERIITQACVAVLIASSLVSESLNVQFNSGPCVSGQRNDNAMRIQLQLGRIYTAPGTPVLNAPDPGVTVLMARNALDTLYRKAQTDGRFPSSLNGGLRSAIIRMSQTFGAYSRAGGITGRKITFTQEYIEPGRTNGWRIDADNLRGTNLQF